MPRKPIDWDNVEPWERQKGETQKSFAAFTVYRDMGSERSLSKLSQKLVKNKVTLAKWSVQWEWQERVGAWDVELDRQGRLAQIAAVQDMNERHVILARAMLGIVARRLQSVEPGTLSPSDVVKWADVSAKLERLARGEATDRVDIMERVRQMARDLGLSPSEEASAVAEAERVVRGHA